jgi:deoxyribose-phosphate aldolase
MIDIKSITPVNDSEIESRIKTITACPLKSLDSKQAFKLILSVIDLTTLEGSDTDEKVIAMCQKARQFHEMGNEIPDVAAVCVYPTLIKIAKNALKGTDIHVASVAGAFPSGQSPMSVKLAEIKYAIEEGADEIDMVISRGKFLQGEFNIVFDEIAAIKDLCKQVHLKVILETGELQTLTNIRIASDMAISAGGDFIKTSTGKISPAATEQAFLVMLDAIKDHFNKTGKMIGIKPAGGISEPSIALNYLKLLENLLGQSWMNKEYFRFGASRLADKVLAEILPK